MYNIKVCMDKADYRKSLSLEKFQVIKKALDVISHNNFTPHLEILFSHYSSGVIVPDKLRESYSSQVLIILQHQFYDLKVFEDKFSVYLSFYGKKDQITVPFFSICEFHDKISGDTLIFDSSTDSVKEHCSEKYIKNLPGCSIMSIKQLRNQ